MRSRTIVRGTGIAVGVLTLAAAVVVGFSPYRSHPGFDGPAIVESVDVDVPCERLFDYLGDSRHAADWSVFVDHITPLNPDEAADGAVGSVRRSFRNPDETGMRWDELFLEVEAPARRRLRVYDVVDAPLYARGDLVTEQRYDALGPGRCRLSFTLAFEREPSLADRARMTVGAHRIARIFRSNIANVKRLAEAAAGEAGAP